MPALGLGGNKGRPTTRLAAPLSVPLEHPGPCPSVAAVSPRHQASPSIPGTFYPHATGSATLACLHRICGR